MIKPVINNTNVVITIAAVVVVIYGMQAAKVLLVPFLLAIFLALITIRPMLWLQDTSTSANHARDTGRTVQPGNGDIRQ